MKQPDTPDTKHPDTQEPRHGTTLIVQFCIAVPQTARAFWALALASGTLARLHDSGYGVGRFGRPRPAILCK
jgi:hypothetical protein